jgi:hypothetical protein
MRAMGLQTLTPREASIFACFTDTVVAPADGLPEVRHTDAAEFFDRWMGRAPGLNRAAIRVMLHAIELSPWLLGLRGRLRQLPPERRAEWLARLEGAPAAQARQLTKMVKSFAFLSYYGDDRVMLMLGYDAAANVERGRRLRALEGRP